MTEKARTWEKMDALEGKKEREAVPGQTQQSGESEEKMTKRNNEEEDSQERSGSW